MIYNGTVLRQESRVFMKKIIIFLVLTIGTASVCSASGSGRGFDTIGNGSGFDTIGGEFLN